MFSASIFNLQRLYRHHIRLTLLLCCLALFCEGQKARYDSLRNKYDRFRNEELYDSALFVAKNMSRWALQNQTDSSLLYAVSLRYMGNCFDDLEISDSALFYWDRSLEALHNQGRSDCLDAAYCFNNLAIYYRSKRDYKVALSYYKKSLDIRRKYLGDDDLDVAWNLGNLGDMYSEVRDYALAESCYKNSLEIYVKRQGLDHADVAMALSNLGDLYHKKGDFVNAKSFLEKSLEVRRKIYRSDPVDIAAGLNSLAVLYSDLGNFKTAKEFYVQSLKIYKKYLGSDDINVARVLGNLGNTCAELGDHASAEDFGIKSLELYKKIQGHDHEDVASALLNLGTIYFLKGDYRISKLFFDSSLSMRLRVQDEDNPDVADNLNNLAYSFYGIGEYKSAEPLYKQALIIYKNHYGDSHPDVAMILHNLGLLYHSLGDFNSAMQLYTQSIDIYRKNYGEIHPDVAGALNDLGVLHYDLSDYNSSERFYRQSLDVFRSTLGGNHPDIATGLMNLGNVYQVMGEIGKAEIIYKQALEIYKGFRQEEHPRFALNLINLGLLFSERGDYALAESIYKQALNLLREKPGPAHPDVAWNLICLGGAYTGKGDFGSAETVFRQALEIYRRALGAEHPDIAMALTNLAELYYGKGNYISAALLYRESYGIHINNLMANFSWLSTREKEMYWLQEIEFYSNLNAFSISARNEVPAAAELSYNASLVSKSLLLETARELDQAIANSTDTNLLAQFQELKQLRRFYNKLQSEDATDKGIMERYKRQADSLDKILMKSFGEYATAKRKFEITWKDVQTSLSATDAAIEFGRYYDDKDSAYKYMAMVVRAGYEYPKALKLADEVSIRSAVERKDFSALYNLIWSDLESLLMGVETVYYSPIGELNNVSFTAMCYQGADSVLSALALNRGGVISGGEEKRQGCNAVLLDRYRMSRLTTTRYLADGTLAKARSINLSLTLFGGIDYDNSVSTHAAAMEEISKNDFAFHLNLMKEHARSKGTGKDKRSDSDKVIKMDYLPGTKQEVVSIAGLLANDRWNVRTRTGAQAGEYELKQDLEKQAPAVLHIATHGFAFADEIKKGSGLLEPQKVNSYKVAENPMVRCGLMFSGSNISWTGNAKQMIERTGEDGILTAAEVADLDLSDTKLVVLSACETGLGKIEGAEGTFGLMRGFKLAGVEQLIVSLWKVPDSETQELMTNFYQALSKSNDPVASFEKAQKTMRLKYPNEPEKWAGFVLVR
jgi:tetratricopeptide (TPR) repeat protein